MHVEGPSRLLNRLVDVAVGLRRQAGLERVIRRELRRQLGSGLLAGLTKICSKISARQGWPSGFLVPLLRGGVYVVASLSSRNCRRIWSRISGLRLLLKCWLA
eukprot:2174260-Pleurochrysis_carterae.AAC.1